MIKSVLAVIKQEDHILFLKRHPYDRTLPNVYCLPGGKVDNNETLEEALKREVKEETNLDVVKHDYIDKNFVTLNGKEFEMNFYLVQVSDLNIKLSNEHESYRWIKIEDLMFENIPQKTKETLCSFFNVGKEISAFSKIADYLFSNFKIYRNLTGKHWYQYTYKDWDSFNDSLISPEEDSVPIITEYRRYGVKY